ncbi:MAG: (p)ppGpp synthetase, partial [Spirochaetota bacterium]|nr:(p)ppGpp synthetase [Spirochaetota bacterium]
MKDHHYYPDRIQLQEAYALKLPVYEEVLENFLRRLDRDLKEQGVRFSLKFRVKSFSSYYKKMLRKIGGEKNPNNNPNIQDILGIRIVCPFLESLQSVEEILRSHYTLFEVERKGAEHSFREFGYQSIHLLLELPEDLRESYPELDIDICEVQIRTILQDAWSEVEHELVYKANFTPYDESLRRKLAALNANLSLSDVIFQEIRDYQRSLHTELRKRRRSFTERVETETSGTSLKSREEFPVFDL